MINMGAGLKIKFTYWLVGDNWLGYLDEFQDYQTQGSSLEDLKEHLADIYKDCSTGMIPSVRKRGELDI